MRVIKNILTSPETSPPDTPAVGGTNLSFKQFNLEASEHSTRQQNRQALHEYQPKLKKRVIESDDEDHSPQYKQNQQKHRHLASSTSTSSTSLSMNKSPSGSPSWEKPRDSSIMLSIQRIKNITDAHQSRKRSPRGNTAVKSKLINQLTLIDLPDDDLEDDSDDDGQGKGHFNNGLDPLARLGSINRPTATQDCTSRLIQRAGNEITLFDVSLF